MLPSRNEPDSAPAEPTLHLLWSILRRTDPRKLRPGERLYCDLTTIPPPGSSMLVVYLDDADLPAIGPRSAVPDDADIVGTIRRVHSVRRAMRRDRRPGLRGIPTATSSVEHGLAKEEGRT